MGYRQYLQHRVLVCFYFFATVRLQVRKWLKIQEVLSWELKVAEKLINKFLNLRLPSNDFGWFCLKNFNFFIYNNFSATIASVDSSYLAVAFHSKLT